MIYREAELCIVSNRRCAGLVSSLVTYGMKGWADEGARIGEADL